MDIKTEIPTLLIELDTRRMAAHLSYQDVADACGVSKATIYRALTGATEPTYQLVQKIADAVGYAAPSPEPVLEGYTQEAYIAYLKATIQRQADEHDKNTRQLHAQYNMLRRQDRRAMTILGIVLGILVLFICCLFLYDFTHLDRGWIQAGAQGIAGVVSEMLLCFS